MEPKNIICPKCGVEVLCDEQFCYKCGAEISSINQKDIFAELDEKSVNSEINIPESNRNKQRAIRAICLSLTAIFVFLSIFCFVDRNNCLKKKSEYESNIKSMDKVVEEIEGLEQDLVEKVDLLNRYLYSFDYDTVYGVHDYITELNQIGNKLLDKINEAGDLGFPDYKLVCDNLNIDDVVDNYNSWRESKLDYIANEYNDFINSPDYQDMGINARAVEEMDRNIPFEISYKMNGSDIVSGISDVDFKSWLNSRIDNETANENNLFIGTIVFGVLVILSLIICILNFKKFKRKSG